MNNIWESLLKMGWIVWPLMICSVLALAIILDRSCFYLRLRFRYLAFRDELVRRMSYHDSLAVQNWCRKQSHPVADVAASCLAAWSHSHRDAIVSRCAQFWLERLEERLKALMTLSQIAPMLGLLGTVTGLVSAFQTMESLTGPVRPQDLAGGIWVALGSTIYGLVIAIPCLVLYYFLESHIDKIRLRMEAIVADIEEYYGQPIVNESFSQSLSNTAENLDKEISESSSVIR